MQQGNIDQSKALSFILAGNALFTLKSNKTGTRFTYKVLIDQKNNSMYSVSYMNGKDNTKDFKKVGHIEIVNSMPKFKCTAFYERESKPVVAFDVVFLNLCISLYMKDLEIWHEGRCCRCGRVLTVPESIEMGIGPECIFQDKKF